MADIEGMSEVKKFVPNKTTCYLKNIKQPRRVMKRIKLSFQRLGGEIQLYGKNMEPVGSKLDVALTVIDINEIGVGFFVNQYLSKGSLIELRVVDGLNEFRVKGSVTWCAILPSGMGFYGNTDKRYNFRTGMRFLYEGDQDIENIAVFCKNLRDRREGKSLPKVLPPAATPAASGTPANGAPSADFVGPMPLAAVGAPPLAAVPPLADAGAAPAAVPGAAPAAAPVAVAAAPADAAAAPAAAVAPAPAATPADASAATAAPGAAPAAPATTPAADPAAAAAAAVDPTKAAA